MKPSYHRTLNRVGPRCHIHLSQVLQKKYQLSSLPVPITSARAGGRALEPLPHIAAGRASAMCLLASTDWI